MLKFGSSLPGLSSVFGLSLFPSSFRLCIASDTFTSISSSLDRNFFDLCLFFAFLCFGFFRLDLGISSTLIPLSFDANNGYSSSVAIMQGRILENMGAAHFEEPVAQHDLQGLKECANALDIPVSFGEQQHTRWQFRDLIELGNPDILQPDIVLAGGITESRRIYDLAGTYGKLVMPHCPSAGIASAASLQLYSTYLTAVRPHEYSIEFSGQASELFKHPYKISDGYVQLPDDPGLGLELNKKTMEKLII